MYYFNSNVNVINCKEMRVRLQTFGEHRSYERRLEGSLVVNERERSLFSVTDERKRERDHILTSALTKHT